MFFYYLTLITDNIFSKCRFVIKNIKLTNKPFLFLDSTNFSLFFSTTVLFIELSFNCLLLLKVSACSDSNFHLFVAEALAAKVLLSVKELMNVAWSNLFIIVNLLLLQMFASTADTKSSETTTDDQPDRDSPGIFSGSFLNSFTHSDTVPLRVAFGPSTLQICQCQHIANMFLALKKLFVD